MTSSIGDYIMYNLSIDIKPKQDNLIIFNNIYNIISRSGRKFPISTFSISEFPEEICKINGIYIIDMIYIINGIYIIDKSYITNRICIFISL